MWYEIAYDLRRDCWELSVAGVRRGHGEEKKKTDNEILKLRVFGVEVLELRKYYNIQIEYKNKYDTFQVQHLIATVQIAIKASLWERGRFPSFFFFSGSLRRDSGVGIFFYGKCLPRNRKAMHQNAKRNYIYANVLRCRVNYQSTAGDWTGEWVNILFMVRRCGRLHCAICTQL